MTITTQNDNGKITFLLDGWLDTEAAPLLGEEINKIESADEIIIDLDNVLYIASSGLRQIVAAHKKAKALNAPFTVINVHTEIMTIFDLTGLNKKINVIKAE